MCTFHSYLESPFFEEKRIVSNRFSISFLYAHSLFAHGLNAFRDNNRQLSFIRVNIFIESDNPRATCFVLLAYIPPLAAGYLTWTSEKADPFCPVQKVALIILRIAINGANRPFPFCTRPIS